MDNDALNVLRVDTIQELERLVQENYEGLLANSVVPLPDPTPRSAHSAGPLTHIPFSAIPGYFLSTWTADANLWAMIAGRSSSSLARRILVNHVSLETLVNNHLEFEIGTVNSVVEEVLADFVSRGMVPHDIDFRSLVTTLLRCVAPSYLTAVWHAVDSLLCVPDPVLIQDPLYGSFAATHGALEIPAIIGETTWDRRFGYRFWHTINADNTITWFDNPATRHFLRQGLVNQNSIGFFSVADVRTQSAQHSPANREIEVTAEKVVFALSWLVVEMRSLALPYYNLGGQSLILTEHRVQDVALEYRLILDFFSVVLSEPAARREALVNMLWALSR